jgi:hypothetical protein
MSSARNAIGAGLAKAELAVAKATGVQLGISHRSSDPAAFWGTVLEERVSFEPGQGHRQMEVLTVEFLIPAQSPEAVDGYDGEITIFPMTADAKPLTEGDRIEYPISSGRYLHVVDVPKVTHHGYCYHVTAESSKSLAAGVRS